MRFAAAVLLLLACAQHSPGHPGGLDAKGGHHDRRNGGYHYHNQSSPPLAQPVAPPSMWQVPEVRVQARVKPRTGQRTEARTEDHRSMLADEFKPVAKSPYDGLTEEEKNERLADAKLKIAKKFLEEGKTEIAVKWLHECVRLFPKTKAATEARLLIAKHDRGF